MAHTAPYLQVAGDLRARIASGEWRTGGRLPSRAHLAEEYGVGRNVTQRAVDLLIVEGLLEGRAGSGTYVRTPRTRRRLVRSLARDVSAAVLARTDITELGRASLGDARSNGPEPAPARIAARLGIAEGDLCVRTEYEFLADLQPAHLGTSWEPVAITKGTPVMMPEMGPLKGIGVIARMRTIGVTVASVKETPRPGRATVVTAAQLGLNPGDLVLHIERTFYDTTGRAVETADFTVPDVRWELVYEIGVPGA